MTQQYLFHVDPRADAEEGDELAIQVRMKKAVAKVAPKVRFVATPNGARRTMWEARQAKAEGMSKGYPDVNLLWPGPGFAIVEVKARNGSLSVDQIQWLNFLTQAGFNCGVFNNTASLLAKLQEWGAPLMLRAAA